MDLLQSAYSRLSDRPLFSASGTPTHAATFCAAYAMQPKRERLTVSLTAVIANLITTYFCRVRRGYSFSYIGKLPYAIPALALTAMLV